MNILPQLKLCRLNNEKTLPIKNICWNFESCKDKRVINEALRISESFVEGFPICIVAGDTCSEAYKMEILKDRIEIASEGAPGAFYGLQTLKQLIKNNSGVVFCGLIEDAPDMEHRGFYQDITRGKIPTVETIKALIDKMAECKMNSLQLYVEHVFDFPEYEHCKNQLGFITEAEIKEIDDYCYERFIDFIPSLSCFGHLYHLLQNGKYAHLCEIPDYEPYEHYFFERMCHHTINPILDESFELVSTMIDRYSSVFRSKYFNICCDETFDLGTGVNQGMPKDELFFVYVTKLINFVKSKGKIPMMWGDIILKYPNKVKKLPEDVVFLNWGYADTVPEEKFAFLGNLNKNQIVCPGTNSWNRFCENIVLEEKNIAIMAEYGYKHGAKGMLNTNWGDFGNIASIDMATYGLACGGAISWNKETTFDDYFRKLASKLFYGSEKAVGILAELCSLSHQANWRAIIKFDGLLKVTKSSTRYDEARAVMNEYICNAEDREIYIDAIKKCQTLEMKLFDLDTLTDNMYREMLLCIRGHALLVKWNSSYRYIKLDCYVDFESFRDDYSKMWMQKNKESELSEVIAIFDRAEEFYNNQN